MLRKSQYNISKIIPLTYLCRLLLLSSSFTALPLASHGPGISPSRSSPRASHSTLCLSTATPTRPVARHTLHLKQALAAKTSERISSKREIKRWRMIVWMIEMNSKRNNWKKSTQLSMCWYDFTLDFCSFSLLCCFRILRLNEIIFCTCKGEDGLCPRRKAGPHEVQRQPQEKRKAKIRLATGG